MEAAIAVEDQDYVVLRASDIQNFNEASLPLPTEKLLQIQQWLAPTDYTSTSSEYGKHCASHLAGTGTWILHTDQYQLWHNSDRGALWIKAVAGAGKSVIAATLTSKLATEEVPVLYFFFRHIVSANQKPQSLVRDYLSQVLDYSPELQHSLYKLVKDGRFLDSVSLDELWKMLVAALARLPRVYCVADALDEMDLGNEFFLHHLVALAEKNPTAIKVLMTSRPVPRVEQILRHQCVLQIAMEPQLVHSDISVYVRHRVGIFTDSERIRSQVHESMCTRANGHFLYARLMMDDLLEPSKNLFSSEKELISALKGLPKPMADMYAQLLFSHSQRSAVPQELQLMLLQWVTGSERPLRVLELASMIDFKRSVLGMSKDSKSVVREGCGPLLEILEDETVCPIHHSFTEYLYNIDRPDVNLQTTTFAVLDYEETQRAIAINCIRYLASGWQNDMRAAKPGKSLLGEHKALKMRNPFLGYAASYWHSHLRKSGAEDATVVSELDAFLRDPEILTPWLELTDPASSHYKLFTTWNALHAAAAKGLGFYVEHLIENGYDIECSDSEQHTPLSIAARNGHHEVVDALLKHGAQGDRDDVHGLKPLHRAASRNHHSVVKVLLESGIDPHTPKTRDDPGGWCGNAPTTGKGRTAVKYACQNGHVETIKAFVPYLKGDELNRALSWAIGFGQTKVAMAILEVPGIDVNCVIEHQTPLHLACYRRDIELMRLLLDMGADIHILSSNLVSRRLRYRVGLCETSISPLQAFAKSNDSRADWDANLINQGFEMLLDLGLDPNTADSEGFTVLHDIVCPNDRWPPNTLLGMEKTLLLLFDRGLSPTSLTHDGSNALHLASGVSGAAIKVLSARGVDIDQVRDSDGKTPLVVALERKDVVTAQHLLDCGADANLADVQGNTPLHFLAKLPENEVDLDMINFLIAAGADVNGRNKDGNTPLHLGEVNQNLLTVFLEHGFELEAKNRKGHTLLFQSMSKWVASQPHATLVNAGASILTRDSQGSTILHAILIDIQVDHNKTTDLLRYFVEKGVDPLSVDNAGNTLWHVVAKQGAHYRQKEQLAVMNLLMEYGLSPTAKNYAGRTPLLVALSVDRKNSYYTYDPVEFLLEHTSADVNVADYDKIRPIHLTASFDPESTCLLLKLGADPTLVTVEGQTPLMVACRARQSNIVCILLDYFKDKNQLSLIDQTDNHGRSALHYACKSGRPEMVAFILSAGANVNLKDKDKCTPFHMCAEYMDEQALWERLSRNGYGPKMAYYVLSTDLLRPSAERAFINPVRIRETIRLLVAHGADISFLEATEPEFHFRGSPSNRRGNPSNRGGNPLSYAISQGCEAMVSELLAVQDRVLQARLSYFEQNSAGTEGPSDKVKEDIDAVKRNWKTALSSYSTRIRFLRMRHMPEIIAENVKPGENNLWLVQQLLREDDETQVEEVKRLGACFLELDNDGQNPLYQMASWGFTDLMRRIGEDAAQMHTPWTLEKAPLNVNWRGRLTSILHTALTREIPNLEMVKLLVSEFMLNPNESFSDHHPLIPYTSSFVHLAAIPLHWWQTKALEFFLENGGNIEALDSKEETPLIAAIRGAPLGNYGPTRIRAVEILLLHGANPNAVDKNGLTCLNIAMGQPECVKLLLRHGASLSLLGVRRFIFDAIKQQDLDALQIAVESGADMNVMAQPGPESRTGETDRTQFVGALSVDALFNFAYPVHIAASHFFATSPGRKRNATKIINLLLEAGADPFLFYKDGSSIVHILAEQGGILEPFFHRPSFDTESRDGRGRTLLLAACNYRPDPMNNYDKTFLAPFLSLLLKRGASITAVDHDGCNALHFLISALPRRDCDDHSTSSSILEPLMSLAAKPNLRGRTPFHYAVASNRFELMDALISHGADPLVPDPLDGSSALHHLAPGLTDHTDILIHDPGAIVTSGDISDLSTEPNKVLASKDDVRQYVHRKLLNTPEKLAFAQLYSPHRNFTSLLASGLSIEACDHTGETPLFKLVTADLGSLYLYDVECNLFSAFKVFEDAGANFQARNHMGESVLHKLATRIPVDHHQRENVELSKEFQKIFTWLVKKKGVDVGWEDESNRTCLDIAAATGAQWVLDLYKRK